MYSRALASERTTATLIHIDIDLRRSCSYADTASANILVAVDSRDQVLHFRIRHGSLIDARMWGTRLCRG